MAPNGSEFSHRVWISNFSFFPLALSLRNFTGSNWIVPMYVYTILLRNTRSRSSWKTIAGVISWWFWSKHFAHNFILYSKCSKKIHRPPILYLNTLAYLLWIPGVVCLCFGGKKGSVTIPHCDSGSVRNILWSRFSPTWTMFICTNNVQVAVERRTNRIVTKCDKRDKICSSLRGIGIPHREFKVNMRACLSTV
jgi:hypothetical protein